MRPQSFCGAAILVCRAFFISIAILLIASTAYTLTLRPERMHDLAGLGFISLWLFVFGLPSATLFGTPTYLLASAVGAPRLVSALSVLIVTVVGAEYSHPLLERCGASFDARKRIEAQVSNDDASTLRGLQTLDHESCVCTLFFEFRQNGRLMRAEAHPDFIHGTKLRIDDVGEWPNNRFKPTATPSGSCSVGKVPWWRGRGLT